jgi:VWFA-related protein
MRILQPALCSYLACSLVFAQAPGSQQAPVVIRSGAQEVLLDLVVRDKHERIVKDLTPADFEVYEDGVKQDIRGFRLVAGAETREQAGPAATAGSTPTKLNPNREINLIMIVFRMIGGAKERQLAKEAADEFLKTELRPNTYIGIFSLDYRLNALSPFSNNPDALRKAIDKAASQQYSEFAKMSDVVLSQSELAVTGSGGQNGGGMTVTGGAVSPENANTATMGADVGTSEGANVMRGILNAQRRIFAGGEGIRELEALKQMVQELGALPGRKTVLLLTTGLQLPPEQLEVARGLVGTANRYNVSLYAVDVNGLTTYSANAANAQSIRETASISRTQGQKQSATTFEQATQDDRLTYGLRAANQQESLSEITQNTGGFLIANTNDLKKPLHRVMEDVNTHYELAYSPKNDVYNGQFRKIEVKLHREGLRVQARNGYFALPELNGKPVEAYEVAALNALNAKPAPRDLEFHVNVSRFRPTARGWQEAVTFEVPTSALTAATLDNPARKRIHTSMLALIKDQSGQVVDKISRDVPYEVPADKFDAFKAGNIIISQPFSLAPGRYLAEVAVLDNETMKAGTRKISLLVPQPAPMAVSSISLVRRVDPLKTPANPYDPFEFATNKVTPTLDSSLPKGTQTGLYFVLYPSAANPEKPKLVVQYLKDGKEIGRQMPEINDSAKDASGAVPMVTTAALDPGSYEVRVTLLQGKEAAQQAATFTIEP